MQSTWTWSQVITNLKGITAKTSGNTSVTTDGKWGVDTTNGMWMYIPSNAYYSTGHWLNVPWNTCKGVLESMVGGGMNFTTGNHFAVGSLGNGSTGFSYLDITNYNCNITVPSGASKILVLFIAVSDTNWLDPGRGTPPDISVSNGSLIKEYVSIAKGHSNNSTSMRIILRSYSVTSTSRVTTSGPNFGNGNDTKKCACEGWIFY